VERGKESFSILNRMIAWGISSVATHLANRWIELERPEWTAAVKGSLLG
jgi:hypothetical protein